MFNAVTLVWGSQAHFLFRMWEGYRVTNLQNSVHKPHSQGLEKEPRYDAIVRYEEVIVRCSAGFHTGFRVGEKTGW